MPGRASVSRLARMKMPARRAGRFMGIGRFGRDRRGAAAVEFAIVAVPFFIVLLATIETALVFFSGQTLETGVSNAARMIRTGQVQTQGVSESQFRDLVCETQPTLSDCVNKLVVDIRSFPDFGSVDLPPPLDNDGNLTNNNVYQPGAAGDVVVVRTYYVWDLLLPDPITQLNNMAGSQRLIAATAAFRNEPF